MSNFLDDNFPLKYGWDHVLCRPLENSHLIRDYVKGPCNTNPLVFSNIYLTQNQVNKAECSNQT